MAQTRYFKPRDLSFKGESPIYTLSWGCMLMLPSVRKKKWLHLDTIREVKWRIKQGRRPMQNTKQVNRKRKSFLLHGSEEWFINQNKGSL